MEEVGEAGDNNRPDPVKLAPREKQCLIGLCVGQRPAEIAEELGIGEKAVEKYIASAKKKLKAKTRDHTIALALMQNLIKP